MKFKDFVLIAIIAFGASWCIEYFLLHSKKEASAEIERPGQSFIAQKTMHIVKPLVTDVSFVDFKRTTPTVTTFVETDTALYDFSTEGATLERLRFKRQLGDSMGTIATIFPSSSQDRENRCFLVALAGKTPFFYTLVDRKDMEDTTILVYEVETADVFIRKSFTIYKKKYQIDLGLTVQPKQPHSSLEPRIFFPAPVMLDILDRDIRTIIVSNETGSLTKIPRASLITDKGWFAPTFFGTDNRYFVQAMVNDSNHFVQRAYSKVKGQIDLYAILEGPNVQEETTWNISFYFGPKELAAMGQVDIRLEQTFDYAWFLAPIAKILLAMLVFLKGYLDNYGFAIILLTCLVRVLLLPFAFKSTRSMHESQKKSAEMQRKLHYIQQRYKDNPEQLAKEREEIIRKNGIPGFGGCMTALIQLPVFFALSSMISNSIQLYQAPFIWWIDDLSAKDPYYIIPLLLGLSFLTQLYTVKEVNQRITMIIFGIVLAALSSNWASGVCLYILISTVLAFAQTSIQKRLGWA